MGKRSWRGLALGLLVLATVSADHGAADPVKARMVGEGEAAIWRGVGRLNVAGNRSCTATLISDSEAITAAHCLFNPLTRHRADPKDIKLVLGQRRNTYAALVGVRNTVILPEFVFSGPKVSQGEWLHDLALLQLDRAILPQEATPIAVVDWPKEGPEGILVDIIGFGQDRPYMASIREDCRAFRDGGIAHLECVVLPGLSGAPVTLSDSGVPVLAATVSTSVGTRVHPEAALVVLVAPKLAVLRKLGAE